MKLTFSLLLFLGLTALTHAAETILTVTGPEQTLTFTEESWAKLPRSEVSFTDREGESPRRFSGVSLRELLTQAGAPLGEKFRGRALSAGVLVRCKDGYTVLFALAEFDAMFSERTILLADIENGEPLPPSAAPFRVVVPGDKRGARSARQVVAIELVSFAKK